MGYFNGWRRYLAQLRQARWKRNEVVTPKYLKARKTGQKFPGSMGPKISAAISFVEGSSKPGAWAIIGDLNDAAELMSGAKGTKVCKDVPDDVTWHTSPPEESSPS